MRAAGLSLNFTQQFKNIQLNQCSIENQTHLADTGRPPLGVVLPLQKAGFPLGLRPPNVFPKVLHMKHLLSRRTPGLFTAGLLLLLPLSSTAQIYKWVDANGRTHYSERKEDAGNSKPAPVKITPPPASAQDAKAALPDWQEQERRFNQRQAEQSARSPAPKQATPPRALSDGRSDNTDLSRCNLARDVLSGAVRHGNRAPTDDNDRRIAENDIRNYCR